MRLHNETTAEKGVDCGTPTKKTGFDCFDFSLLSIVNLKSSFASSASVSPEDEMLQCFRNSA